MWCSNVVGILLLLHQVEQCNEFRMVKNESVAVVKDDGVGCLSKADSFHDLDVADGLERVHVLDTHHELDNDRFVDNDVRATELLLLVLVHEFKFHLLVVGRLDQDELTFGNERPQWFDSYLVDGSIVDKCLGWRC